MTPAHMAMSAFTSGPMPPVSPSAHERSSGTLISSNQHTGQHVPASAGDLYWNGGLHSRAAHFTSSQESTLLPAPGEYTGYLFSSAVAVVRSAKANIAVGRGGCAPDDG